MMVNGEHLPQSAIIRVSNLLEYQLSPVSVLFCFLEERNLIRGPSMTRRITDEILHPSSLVNIPRWNVDILAGL